MTQHAKLPSGGSASGRRRNLVIGGVLLIALVAGGFLLAMRGPTEATTYRDPQALAAALEAEGLECSGLQEIEGADDAPFRAARCELEGREMAISVSLTNELPGPYEALFQEHDTGQPAVVGPNWVVEAPYDELPIAEEVRDALGGEILESHLTDKN